MPSSPDDPRDLTALARTRKVMTLGKPGSDGLSKFFSIVMEPEPPKVDRAVLVFREGACFRSGGFCHS